jgi:uncharacterized membrane protein YfcA
MRREFLWYGIASAWAIAAIVGLLQHHYQQALPALLFALVFAFVGQRIARRDQALRERRASAKRQS